MLSVMRSSGDPRLVECGMAVTKRSKRRHCVALVCCATLCLLLAPALAKGGKKRRSKSAGATNSLPPSACARDGTCRVDAENGHPTLEQQWERYLVVHRRMLEACFHQPRLMAICFMRSWPY